MKTFYKSSIFAATLLTLCEIAAAEPSLKGVYFTIDKPSYSSYAVGARVYVDGNGIDIASVSVSHQSINSDSLGTWQLAETSPGSWWSWAAGRPQMPSGPLDGSMTIMVTDVNGQTTTRNDFSFQPLAELELPSLAVQLNTDGYHNPDCQYTRRRLLQSVAMGSR